MAASKSTWSTFKERGRQAIGIAFFLFVLWCCFRVRSCIYDEPTQKGDTNIVINNGTAPAPAMGTPRPAARPVTLAEWQRQLNDRARDSEPAVRKGVILTLDLANDPNSFPILVTLLGDQNNTVAEDAKRVLAQKKEAAIPSLIGGLASAKRETRERSAELLVGLGQPAVQQLIDTLAFPDQALRYHVKTTLFCIGNAGGPQLLSAAQDISNVQVSSESAEVLSWLQEGRILERAKVTPVIIPAEAEDTAPLPEKNILEKAVEYVSSRIPSQSSRPTTRDDSQQWLVDGYKEEIYQKELKIQTLDKDIRTRRARGAGFQKGGTFGQYESNRDQQILLEREKIELEGQISELEDKIAKITGIPKEKKKTGLTKGK